MTRKELADLSNKLPDSGDMGEAIGFPRSELNAQFEDVFNRLHSDDLYTAANIMLRMGMGLGYLYGKAEATKHSHKELMNGEL